jgi:RNA polymerase sigma-70 factor, ECF subfamily
MAIYQQGENRAFEVLYDRYSPRLYGYLRSRCPHPGEAEDLLQHAFLKLHQNRYSYDATLPFMPWVFSIVRNVLVDYVRKRRPTPTEDGKLISMADKSRGDLSDAPREMKDLLALLPPAQRHLIEQRFSEGLSFEEIAGAHGLTAVTVRKRISRTVKTLRDLVRSKT